MMREDVPSWDDTFIETAKVVARRSKDPSTQVGACIVSSSNKILSLGYNGSVRGWDDSEFPWGREGEPLDTKYPFVVHAERNAVLNFEGLNSSFQGAKVYVTHFPCNECAKELAQIGIAEVIYLEKHYMPGGVSTEAAEKIFEICGIVARQHKA